jgi:hypothetical protein
MIAPTGSTSLRLDTTETLVLNPGILETFLISTTPVFTSSTSSSISFSMNFS